MGYWSLQVKNFGKISEAEIQLAPFTCFIGDNNSGKSYLMTLLYGILRTNFRSLEMCTESNEYEALKSWFDLHYQETNKIPLTSIKTQLNNYLNAVLEANKETIVRYAFNKKIHIDSLMINLGLLKDLYVRFSNNEDLHYENENMSMIQLSLYYKNDLISRASGRIRAHQKINYAFFFAVLLNRIIGMEYRNDILFLPTSRTGFLLTFKDILSASIVHRYDENDETEKYEQKTTLTQPCVDFLQNLNSLSQNTRNDKYNEILSFIESDLLDGRIIADTSTPTPEFSYQPNSWNNPPIPMHIASGVITELTPLSLMLQYHETIGALFIEEPEMCLHPELQMNMARVLLRIANQHIPLFITTHSDIIIQHINNMLKYSQLSSAKQKNINEKFGITVDEQLDSKDIAVYQFSVDKQAHRTTVQTLEATPYGFVTPTFNNTLNKIFDMTASLDPEE